MLPRTVSLSFEPVDRMKAGLVDSNSGCAAPKRRYMRGFFDDEAREKPRGGRDTELTLGAGMLLICFFALVLLCGICFGLGFALGSRGAKSPVFQSQTPAAGPAQQLPANTAGAKPSAAAQPPQSPVQPVNAAEQVADAAPAAAPGMTQAADPTQTSAAPAAPQVVTPNNSGWHPVQPAMPGSVGAMQSTQPAATAVRPAMGAQESLLVQIAAVSNREDANVLIGALRRRGYAVSAVHNPGDNLIHVCVGPFNNRGDANSMREKLLSDGYNAVVVP